MGRFLGASGSGMKLLPINLSHTFVPEEFMKNLWFIKFIHKKAREIERLEEKRRSSYDWN